MTPEEFAALTEYAYQEMMEYLETEELDPQENYCFRETTGDQQTPSRCSATTDYSVDQSGHGISPIAEAEHCSFDWTPSPGGTGGAVWHYDQKDGWKFVKSYE